MPKSIHMHRNKKNMLLSGVLHGLLLATLWFTASDISTPEPTPPETVDATILPVTTDVTPEQKPAAAPTIPPTQTKTEAVKPSPSPRTESTRAHTASAPKAQAEHAVKSNTPTTADNGTQTPTNNGHSNNGNPSNNTNTPNNTTSPPANNPDTAVSKPLVNGVPIAVSPIGGFQIEYNVTASKGNIEASGGATLTFKRNDGTYTADLSAKAAIGGFAAHAEGEVRDNTIATTRFKDGRSISFLGMGTEKAGSNFIISYPEKTINFGSTSNGTSPLPYTVVYDYLSAIVYLQALLQQHPEQAQAGNHLQLPIGKRSTVEMATVTFKPSERLSTAEGAFEGAVPASIQIPSGSIQRIDVWLVPERKYRPLQIELGFTSGKVTLISRKSS